MNWEHNDLRAIHDKLEAIHKRVREAQDAQLAILSPGLKALIDGQTKTNDLLASISETLKSIDAKTPDPVDIGVDGGDISLSPKT